MHHLASGQRLEQKPDTRKTDDASKNAIAGLKSRKFESFFKAGDKLRADKDAQGKRLMNNRLPDVEHADVVIREDLGQRMRQAGFVLACDVDQKYVGG